MNGPAISSIETQRLSSRRGNLYVKLKKVCRRILANAGTYILPYEQVVSLFIMSRALIEIVRQVQKDSLPDELGSRLEETVFNQLESVDP